MSIAQTREPLPFGYHEIGNFAVAPGCHNGEEWFIDIYDHLSGGEITITETGDLDALVDVLNRVGHWLRDVEPAEKKWCPDEAVQP